MENYYSAAWDNNLRDADKDLATVLDSCAASSACPLREKSGDLVGSRLDSILDGLKTAPLPVRNGSNYGIVDYPLARGLVFQGLYKPVTQYPPLFAALAEVEKGNGLPLFALSGKADSLWRCDCSTDAPASVGETTAAVACGDGDVVTQDLPQLKQHYANMARQSSFADMWVVHTYCTRVLSPFPSGADLTALIVQGMEDSTCRALQRCVRARWNHGSATEVSPQVPSLGTQATRCSSSAIQLVRLTVTSGSSKPAVDIPQTR